MTTLWQDVLYGFRILSKKPGFTAVTALSLALGIGVNTAIFTLINTILLGPLPYPASGRLVIIWTVPPQHPDQIEGATVPDFMAWKSQARSFEAMGAANDAVNDFGAEESGSAAERIEGEAFTPELLDALRAQPLMGRLFRPEEAQIGATADVIVLSHRLWQRRFNGDPNIVNQNIRMNGTPTTVIGVMKPDFRFEDDNAEYLVPYSFNRFQLQGSGRFLLVGARLKPGVKIGQAQAEMESIVAQLARDFPARDTDHGRPWGVRVQPIREGLYGWINKPLLLLQGAVGFVLLIACANVAALLLARASSRQTEVAIRSALGAKRGRIVRQFLTESVLLSLFGGAFGVVLAWWGVRVLVAMAPPWFPRLNEIGVDFRVLGFTVLISLITGLIFGVVPAVHASKPDFVETLKDSTRGGTAGAVRKRLHAVLVSGQIALAMVLLIGAGLLIHSFLQLEGTELHADPTGLLTFQFQILPGSQLAKVMGFHRGFPLWEASPALGQRLNEVYERIQAVPGVQSATGSPFAPFTFAPSVTFGIEGRPVAEGSPERDALSALYYPATPHYFATLKIAILRGRDFSTRDTPGAPWVAIINETMAKRFWPDEDPIGKHLTLDIAPDERPREIIAIVRDTPSRLDQTKQEPAIYAPFLQVPAHTQGPFMGMRRQMTFVLRTEGDPMKLVPSIRQAVAEIDRNQPLDDMRTAESYLAEQVQSPRYYMTLLALFAAVATLLAAIGIYGVMAHAVTQRTREIGIRLALGANSREVMGLMARQAGVMIAFGLLVGVGASLALTRLLSSLLWGVTATDPVTFSAVSLLLVAVGLLACLVPVRRAMQVDPAVILRYE